MARGRLRALEERLEAERGQELQAISDALEQRRAERQQARKQLRRYSLWCTKLAMTVTRGVTNVSAGRQVLYALAALLALGLTAGIVGVLRVGSDGNAGQVGGGAALQP